jgi:hypothetical protein
MENITFSIRLPKFLCDLLDGEASRESRNRNRQLEAILKERYQAHAPPVTPIHSSKSRNGHKVNRKTKAEIN